MNRIVLQLAFVCAASLFCFGMCSKDDKTQPAAPTTIDKEKMTGTWSITKGLFTYYDGNGKVVRLAGIAKNGLNADLWDHSTLTVNNSTFTQTGIVAQDHLPHTGEWLIIEDGRKLRTIDGGNSRTIIEWEIVSFKGAVLTIRHRESRNNDDEKTAEALLELTKE